MVQAIKVNNVIIFGDFASEGWSRVIQKEAYIGVGKFPSNGNYDCYSLVGEDGTSEKGLSGDVVGSVDWATLGYGNPEINTLILKVLKRFHAQYMREESWRMMISREISNVVSNEGEEAYVYSYAKNQKQYNMIKI